MQQHEDVAKLEHPQEFLCQSCEELNSATWWPMCEWCGHEQINQPVICVAHGQGGAEIASEHSPTLTCNHEAPIAVYAIQNATRGKRQFVALGSSSQQAQAVAFRACGQDGFTPSDISPPICSSDGGGSGVPTGQYAMKVRRLLPVECERLQAFPDGYTNIPVRKISGRRAATIKELRRAKEIILIDGEWWLLAADGPRYKALGNSMCVKSMAWIGRRIQAVLIN